MTDWRDLTIAPSHVNIYFGTGEHPHLSNLYHRPFIWDGVSFISVEDAYQSLKSGKLDLVTHEKYKTAGVKIRGTKAPAENNVEIMHELIEASFDQNPDAKRALVATHPAILTHTQDRSIWRTEFPRILMELRANYIDFGY